MLPVVVVWLSQHLAIRKLYAISKELNMPAETLTEQCKPNLPPAFKEWLVAELRKHYEHEQRSQQAAAQQQQQSPQVPAAGDTVLPWTGQQQQQEEVQPQAQPQQQPQQVAADALAAAAAAGGRAGAGGRPPTGMASDRDVVVSRLSVAFTRIASQNAMERVRGSVAGCSPLPCSR
jgi:hypothetical protein